MARTLLTALAVLLAVSCLPGNQWKSPEVTFQNDWFGRQSRCGRRETGRLHAIHFNFRVPLAVTRSSFTLVATERQTGFQQTIEFKKDHFFYPRLFGPQGHREFELPRCDPGSPECDFGFFVFLQPDLVHLPSTEWTLQLSQGARHEVRVATKIRSDGFFEKIQIEKSKKGIQLSLDRSLAARLLEESYSLEITFVYRAALSQLGYLEESFMLSKDHPWFSGAGGTIQMKKPPEETTYLAAMVIAKKEGINQETKLVVQDDSDPFFSCH
jgi:hypothetical protein